MVVFSYGDEAKGDAALFKRVAHDKQDRHFFGGFDTFDLANHLTVPVL